MSIQEVVDSRSVDSVLHFTTNRGALGIFSERAVKSRMRLNQNDRLEHIFHPNASYRGKDQAWLDYVNLSLARINANFFSVCSNRWHGDKDFWWCIFSFSPEILSHEGVWFTTTNNIYTGVRRDKGVAGLEGMYCDKITRWVGEVVKRQAGCDPSFPTCDQAEVLYPEELSTDFLKCIYVVDDVYADEISAQVMAVSHPEVRVKVAPSMFESR